MATHDPDIGTGATPRRWRWIGIGGVAGIAVLLLVATVWLSQGGGSSVAGATGASSPQDPRGAASATPDPSGTPSEVPAAEPTEPASTAPAAPEAPVAAPLAELPPVPLTEQVAPVPGVVFGIDGLEAVEGIAQGPGEVGGPALRFTLTVRNDTDVPVSLVATVVNLYAGSDQLPMGDLREPGSVPLPEEVAAGGTVTGVFVFAVPLDERDQVKVGVDYTVGVPIVVFEGEAPA